MEVAEQVELKVPKLRFREFEDGWTQLQLGDLLTFKNGVNADKGAYGSGYKFINVLDIIQNDFITHDVILGEVELSEKEVEKNEVRYGDILFQRSSETREEVGQSNVYLDRDKTAVFGGFVIRGRAKKEYDPSFMNGMLKTDQARKEITTRSGGSTRYNIGQQSLEAVTVFIPTLPEQQKIAGFLSAVDEKLKHLNRKKELLQQYKKGVMQQLFSQELRFKKEDGSDYEDWEEKRLGDICQTARSGGTPLSTKREYYDGDIPFLAISDMTLQGKYLTHTSKSISQLGLENSSSWILPIDTIIYSMYASVGFVSINKIPLATSQAVLNIIPKTSCSVEYLYYQLVELQKSIQKFIETGTQGNLNAQSVKALVIGLPCKDEQQKIAAFLSSLDRKIDAVSAQIELTQQFKKGLLQEMFV